MKKNNIITSLKCRCCEKLLHNKLLHFENMPLTDEFIRIEKPHKEYLRDIEIYKCELCGLVQNPIDFDHAEYYETYNYTSGHSEFTKKFMLSYAKAAFQAYVNASGRAPGSVLEVGSGDGEQLRAFSSLGVANLLGIEPSASLVAQSEIINIPTFKGLFSASIISELEGCKFDICLSSYTLDHVRSPNDYLEAAHQLLTDGGILAFEVHDFSKISQRSEWCLFEHEHTIYMDESMARSILLKNGFEVVAVNPLDYSDTRANSLIILAKKKPISNDLTLIHKTVDMDSLRDRINLTISKIDAWINQIPPGDRLVGYGAGGRGVMTLAALKDHGRFETIFDSNYKSGKLLTPKTHIPVSGIDLLSEYKGAWCLVFSFGYMAEIKDMLLKHGFSNSRVVALNSFYS